MRIYIDTSPIIDYIENTPGFGPKVSARINVPGVALVSSDLAWMETLVLPLQTGNAGLEKDYDDFFTIRVAEMVPLVSRVFRNAANIRAQFNFKTPDAIHLAADAVFSVIRRCRRPFFTAKRLHNTAQGRASRTLGSPRHPSPITPKGFDNCTGPIV
jgi:hypothetical protein